MAPKRKAAKKAAKKVAKKKSAQDKTRAGKSSLTSRSKSPRPSEGRRVKNNQRRGSSREAEPSSGSASSSLDPYRAGRLRVNNPDENARRRRIGDLQGIRMKDRADEESVGELLEEGQTLEAETLQGVEDALDADQGEIHTHEVPEDDVPGEYLEPDR